MLSAGDSVSCIWWERSQKRKGWATPPLTDQLPLTRIWIPNPLLLTKKVSWGTWLLNQIVKELQNLQLLSKFEFVFKIILNFDLITKYWPQFKILQHFNASPRYSKQFPKLLMSTKLKIVNKIWKYFEDSLCSCSPFTVPVSSLKKSPQQRWGLRLRQASYSNDADMLGQVHIYTHVYIKMQSSWKYTDIWNFMDVYGSI